MKKYTRIQSFCFVCTIILCMSLQTLFAQKKGSEKVYNLAVYATGIQNDQKLSSSIQTVTQNRTITMLTSSGKYRLIERSSEFLQQIRSEQSMQQSGDVADGQIAELGAGFGAEKICVVSVTIIDNYLYIATRIVDVATKSSFESGDAETNNYTSLPFLTQTLEIAVNKMLGKRTIKLLNNNIPSDVQKKNIEPVKTTSENSAQQQPSVSVPVVTPSNTSSTQQQPSISVSVVSPSNTSGKLDYYTYAYRLKNGNVSFLDVNSLAYEQYKSYQQSKTLGRTYTILGISLLAWGIVDAALWITDDAIEAAEVAAGSCSLGIGIGLLCTKNIHLRKSYKYYINGEVKTASLDIHPYLGTKNVMGMGFALRF